MYQVTVKRGRKVLAVYAGIKARSGGYACQYVRDHLLPQMTPPSLRYTAIAEGRVATLTHLRSRARRDLLRSFVAAPGRTVRDVERPYASQYPCALYVQGVSLPTMRDLVAALGLDARVSHVNGTLMAWWER